MSTERPDECSFHSCSVFGSESNIHVIGQPSSARQAEVTMPDLWRCHRSFCIRSGAKSAGVRLGTSLDEISLTIASECMVNGGDNYRRHITHTCHKHCRGVDESKTGGMSSWSAPIQVPY